MNATFKVAPPNLSNMSCSDLNLARHNLAMGRAWPYEIYLGFYLAHESWGLDLQLSRSARNSVNAICLISKQQSDRGGWLKPVLSRFWAGPVPMFARPDPPAPHSATCGMAAAVPVADIVAGRLTPPFCSRCRAGAGGVAVGPGWGGGLALV